MTVAANLFGANATQVLEQLAREQKRQTRGAANAAAITTGELDDAEHVALLAGDIAGYLPPVTPDP